MSPMLAGPPLEFSNPFDPQSAVGFACPVALYGCCDSLVILIIRGLLSNKTDSQHEISFFLIFFDFFLR